MRWLVGSLFLLLIYDFIYAQMSKYGPSSTEWLQSGHDYKKTRRAPLKCTSPANVYRVWTSEDSPGNLLGPGSAVYNNTYDYNNDGVIEVTGGGIDAGFFSDGLVWFLHDAGTGANIASQGWGSYDDYFTYWATGYTPSGPRTAIQVNEPGDQWSDDKTRFILMNSTGNFIYNQDLGGGTPVSDMTVADVDNNGCPEIYVMHGSEFRAINMCANSYSVIWSVPQSGVWGSAITQFGGQSYAVISTSSGIAIRNAANGALVNTISFGASTLPTLADIDGDGIDEIIVGGSNSVRAYKFDGTLVWNYTFSGNPSNIAVGRILPGNQLGVAFLSGGLYVLRASDGAYITGPVGSYFLDPSIADMNGDGVEGVIVSDGCGNPKEHSYVNGWTNPVWSAAGCADEPPISSDLIISKWYITGNPPQGKLVIVEGDVSCFTNVWHCNSAEEITPLDVSEITNKPSIYYEKGYIKISNYNGNVEIYDVSGKRIISSKVVNEGTIKLNKQGIFILKLKDKTYKLVADGR